MRRFQQFPRGIFYYGMTESRAKVLVNTVEDISPDTLYVTNIVGSIDGTPLETGKTIVFLY